MHAAQTTAAAAKPAAIGENLTRYVAGFVQETTVEDLPPVVVENGKKSILDGLGLALSARRRSPARSSRPDVKAMIEKVDFVVDERAEAAGYHKMTTYIDVTLAGGRMVSGVADFGKGSPASPMTFDEVADKFRQCAKFAGWDEGRAADVIAMVRDFEGLTTLEPLMAALSRS